MSLAQRQAKPAPQTPDFKEFSDAEIVALCQQGDEAAYLQLYRRFSRQLYSLAYQMMGSHQEADEVLQETFIRVFKNLERLRSPEAFTAWVYQITVNLCMDHRKYRARTRARVQQVNMDEEYRPVFELATSRWVRNPQQVLENKELLGEITMAIEALPDQQKAVVIMHEVEGLSKKLIAETLQCSLVTVRTNLHHARKKLRKHLQSYMKT